MGLNIELLLFRFALKCPTNKSFVNAIFYWHYDFLLLSSAKYGDSSKVSMIFLISRESDDDCIYWNKWIAIYLICV